MKHFRKMPEVFKFWIVLAIATTFLSFLIYVTAQQILRQSANDPQTQMAEDLTSTLGSGKNPEQLISQTQIDLASSLDSYVIVYNSGGSPIASSALLDGKIPTPPIGVLDYAKTHGINKITWQPKEGIRNAIVVKYFNDTSRGYVLVGRSLQLVEIRENVLLKEVILGWGATMLATLIASFIISRFQA